MTSNNRLNADTLLSAARAESIPEGWSGLWHVKRGHVEHDMWTLHNEERKLLPAGVYTHLFRVTDSTMFNDIPGEVVMEDTPFELQMHLDFMMRAHGRVLVTGLGLGCVVRGLLANPHVQHVTCIEKSEHVLSLVQPYMPEGERLQIVHDDALQWTARALQNEQPFDCAWHDIWTDRDNGDPMLEKEHAKLIFNCRPHVEWQGAWAFPRVMRRFLRDKGVKVL